MVWYFIGVYIINRTLHGRLEIRNLSSCVEIFHSFAEFTHENNIFQHLKRNFVSPHDHVISSIYSILKLLLGLDSSLDCSTILEFATFSSFNYFSTPLKTTIL